MRIELRVLLLAGLLAAVPSCAGACEQKLDATATAAPHATATCTAPMAAASACSGSSVAIAKSPVTSKPVKKSRRHWSPGHLVEPDSMRLVPGERTPGEQWVIISSRTGSIQVHRTPWTPKKSENRNLSQNAPHHS